MRPLAEDYLLNHNSFFPRYFDQVYFRLLYTMHRESNELAPEAYLFACVFKYMAVNFYEYVAMGDPFFDKAFQSA